MNKNQKIKFIDFSTLTFEVLEDLKKGEKFSLLDYFNDSEQNFAEVKGFFTEKQKEECNKQIEEKVNEKIKYYKDEELEKKEKEISQLKSQIKENENLHKKDLDIEKEKTKNEYINQINELKNKNSLKEQKITELIDTHKIEIKNKDESYLKELKLKEHEINDTFKIKIQNLEKQIQNLKNDQELKEKDIKNLRENQKLQIENEVNKQTEALKQTNTELQTKYDELLRSKKVLGTKDVGNDLEAWCEQQVNASIVNVVDDTFIQKDSTTNSNEDNKKADFVVVVKNEYKILLEMKSKAIDTIKTKTNLDYTKKLISDAEHRKINIAILVTELEQDDIFIFKKPNLSYKTNVEVYWCRPEGLVFLVSLIRLFYLKYYSIVIDEITFKDKQEILNDFNTKKDEIINNSLKHINNKIAEIKKQAEKIQSAASSIIADINILQENHLKTIENKLENFRIEQVVKKIEKLNNKN